MKNARVRLSWPLGSPLLGRAGVEIALPDFRGGFIARGFKKARQMVSTVAWVNVSATHAVRFPQLAVVDPDWLHRPLGRPFRAAQPSHNGIVRLGRLLVEGTLPHF